MRLFLLWLLTAATIFLGSQYTPWIKVSSFGASLGVAVVIGLINLIIRPLVLFLTLPVNLLTLGLFTFVVNALMILLADWFLDSFEVGGFWPALLLSLIIGLLSSLVSEAGAH